MSFQNSGIMHRLQNCLKADKSGRPQSEASSCEISDSSCSISAVDRIKLNKNVSTNKPSRDATQMLSILQEPMAVMSNDAESTANSMIGQLSSAKGLKDITVDNQESYEDKDIDGPNEVVDIDNCPDLTSSKSMSNGPGDDRSISSEEAKSSSKRDEFELGF
ncbi:hypothetical protein WN944_024285 [Citrus x changshan-huyou]|uniref:Uncharacterized protein n=1 Tax=Citrus x changshan-huyou TaxID=2935761 RepID=A0AAP0LMP6_9ROSI